MLFCFFSFCLFDNLIVNLSVHLFVYLLTAIVLLPLSLFVFVLHWVYVLFVDIMNGVMQRHHISSAEAPLPDDGIFRKRFCFALCQCQVIVMICAHLALS